MFFTIPFPCDEFWISLSSNAIMFFLVRPLVLSQNTSCMYCIYLLSRGTSYVYGVRGCHYVLLNVLGKSRGRSCVISNRNILYIILGTFHFFLHQLVQFRVVLKKTQLFVYIFEKKFVYIVQEIFVLNILRKKTAVCLHFWKKSNSYIPTYSISDSQYTSFLIDCVDITDKRRYSVPVIYVCQHLNS